MLEGALDRNRAELINTVRGLSDTHARRRLVTSMTTPIGLLKHAAVAERIRFQHVLGGVPENACGGASTPGDPSLIVDDDEPLAGVIAQFERASQRSRAVAAQFDLDDIARHPRLGEVNLRFIYLLAIEDFDGTPVISVPSGVNHAMSGAPAGPSLAVGGSAATRTTAGRRRSVRR